MSWFVDNAHILYVLLGIIGIAFLAAWWLHRRNKLLLGAVIAAGLILLLWLVTRMVVTDRQQLETSVHAMADAALHGKADVLVKLFADDFEFQGRKRKDLADGIVRGAKAYKVSDVVISGFDVEDLQERSAKVFFRATIHHGVDDRPYLVACRASYIKDGGQWRLRNVEFFNPVAANDRIQVPIP